MIIIRGGEQMRQRDDDGLKGGEQNLLRFLANSLQSLSYFVIGENML